MDFLRWTFFRWAFFRWALRLGCHGNGAAKMTRVAMATVSLTGSPSPPRVRRLSPAEIFPDARQLSRDAPKPEEGAAKPQCGG